MMLSGKQSRAFARRHRPADMAAGGKTRFPWLLGTTLAAGLALASATAQAGYVEGMDAFSRGDYLAAYDELRPVAEGGDPNAQFTLGFMFDYGQGVRQSTVEAIWWYRKAAEQGLAVAQFTLGSIFEAGRGTRKDPVEAYRWYSLAATNLPDGEIRDTVSQRRDQIGASLSPTELAEAQALLAGQAALPSEAETPTASARAQTTHDVDRRLLIAEIQAELNRLGYDVGPGSGDLDDSTRGAIKAFQIEQGLEMTGQPSKPLLQALRNAEGLLPATAPAGLSESADGEPSDDAPESPLQSDSTADGVTEAAAPEAQPAAEEPVEPAAIAETASDVPTPAEDAAAQDGAAEESAEAVEESLDEPEVQMEATADAPAQVEEDVAAEPAVAADESSDAPVVAADPAAEERQADEVLATEPQAGDAETVVEARAAPAETAPRAETLTEVIESNGAEAAEAAAAYDGNSVDDETETSAGEDAPAQDIVVTEVSEAPATEPLETSEPEVSPAEIEAQETPANEQQLAAIDSESAGAATADVSAEAEPETAAPSRPSPDLVRDVQEELVRLGYRIGLVDGVAGRRTTGAIEDFQANHGLAVTGLVSEELLANLAKAEPAVLPPADEADPATLARRETIDQQLGSLREIARNVDSPTAALPGWGQLEAWETRTAELLRTRFGPAAAEGLAKRRQDMVLGDPYGNFQRTAEAYRIYLAQLRQSLE